MNKSMTEIQNESNVKALKKARELRGLTRSDLGKKMGTTDKAIEFYENGRYIVSGEKIESILLALEFSWEQFEKIKRGKSPFGRSRETKVLKNQDRRSYQKVITKECRVLKSLRVERGLSQDQASAVCGYPRATIGHIENGRIQLDQSRLRYIVSSYGLEFEKFLKLMGEESLRNEILEKAIERLKSLPEDKLKVVVGVIMSF